MAPFELEEPGSLSEALGLLDPEDPAVRPIAGGTALMLMMKSGLYRPQRLVSLRKVAPGLADIRVGTDGALEIGAMVRLSELQRSAVICDTVPLIAETLRTHSNVRVRNVATIGGNLAHADPHMDLPDDVPAALPRFHSAKCREKPPAALCAGRHRAPEERHTRPALDCLVNGPRLSCGSLHCTDTRCEIAQAPRGECAGCGHYAHGRRSRRNRPHHAARCGVRHPLSDRTNASSEPVRVESLS
jgi:hypothetical protein